LNTIPSLKTENLTIQFGGHIAVDSVTCEVKPGELTVIVGPNGAGKTTWFNLVSGQLTPTSGSINFGGRDVTKLSASARAKVGIGRAFQLTNLFPKLTVLENIRLVVQARAGLGSTLFKSTKRFRHIYYEAENYLTQTRLETVAHMTAAALSHGDQRKLEIALMLAMKPSVFMFDEPTAGMSADEAPVVLELIESIKNDKEKTILLVEHKMDVVRSLADRIIVLHNGKLIADGSPEAVINLPIVREIYLGGSEENTRAVQ